MRLRQPPAPPIPSSTTFRDRTAIVTGGNTGIGLAVARELLRLQCKTLILACRDATRAEAARQTLLAEFPSLPRDTVQLRSLDLDSYSSVHNFAAEIRRDIPVVDLLVLNAGAGFFPAMQSSAESHERTIQTMYLSNVLLLLSLLPHLEASKQKSGRVARVTWVGSRKAYEVPARQAFPGDGQSVLAYYDDPEHYDLMTRYGEAKHLCLAFFYELCRRITRDQVVVNMVCPGAVATELARNVPAIYQPIVWVMHKVVSRSPEKAAWLVVNAAVVAGDDSHGVFFGDEKIEP
ncbi:putative short-chain dehydrogenase/reductase family protein [Aspergillus heteromorphus CBS 117.55]|uniref:Putative short-chain dehydrogenase/reductase family protein n=1 Tax=Aspergillus heteromorphus CBS 117.55 TaxID=1448321 RepID=A0A317V9S1_9EURO|nr:putative short-chain dehydrogenase/reductase family protein [Aspergillus heteromorphus CBS 117.55]PWY69747.1 putative short-chain dehydrogenase/reductase family protein [Aspergillus heteromorphus CBS 117.55]